MEFDSAEFNRPAACGHCRTTDRLMEKCYECADNICFGCVPVEFATRRDYICPKRCRPETPCGTRTCFACFPYGGARQAVIAELQQQVAAIAAQFRANAARSSGAAASLQFEVPENRWVAALAKA